MIHPSTVSTSAFSGLKTAVMLKVREAESRRLDLDDVRADIAAVVPKDALSWTHCVRAHAQSGRCPKMPSAIIVAGGVGANRLLAIRT